MGKNDRSEVQMLGYGPMGPETRGRKFNQKLYDEFCKLIDDGMNAFSASKKLNMHKSTYIEYKKIKEGRK